MSQTELLNKCEAERKYLHKVYEETKAENNILKEEVQFHQESATVAVVLANNFKEELDKLKEELEAEKFHSQQLKDCSYEEYCEYVSENKLIKEFEDLKNELGELKKEKEEYSKAYTATLKRRNWDAYERKKLREEIKKLKEQLK